MERTEHILEGNIWCCVLAQSEQDTPLGLEMLLSEERGILPEGTSPGRIEQFALGRVAARSALENMQRARNPSRAPWIAPPLLRHDFGGAAWPPEFVGSISHARNFDAGQRSSQFAAVSIVAKKTDYSSLGVDLEDRRRPTSTDVLTKIASPTERAWALNYSDSVSPPPSAEGSLTSSSDRIFFILGAKEALFKALYPLSRTYFGFHDAEIECGGPDFPSTIKLLRDLGASIRNDSKFLVGTRIVGNHLLCWVTVPVR